MTTLQSTTEPLILGEATLSLADIVAVARFGRAVEFDELFCQRVNACRAQLEAVAQSEQKYYGITTGLGDNCDAIIDLAKRQLCQRNTVLSHASAVGEPWTTEVGRAMMLVMLVQLSNNAGNGGSGIRLATLRQLQAFLNHGITPIVPKLGSVGYLSLEGYIGMALIGEGEVCYQNQRQSSADALQQAGLSPLVLEAKEGLSLVSGTTSVTALAALAVHDGLQAIEAANLIAAMSLEVLGANVMALDERLHAVRHNPYQQYCAAQLRHYLADSAILAKHAHAKTQDALSLRTVAQCHGAVQKTLADAELAVLAELKSSVDNPLIFTDTHGDGHPDIIMGCNAEGHFLGIEADSCAIALTVLGKICERRTNRLVSRDLSGLPAFLIDASGLNNGLMIQQYTALGLLAEMRLLAHPATIDNGSTSAMQEDIVSMGYLAAKKVYDSIYCLQHILATEWLCALQAYGFYPVEPAPALRETYHHLRQDIPFFTQDTFFTPYIEQLANRIRNQMVLS